MLVLAQALVSRPGFILIDELSLGLAPVVVKRLVPTIQSVAASGVGVLLIEQFAHLALSLAESAYVLEGGRIRYQGTAQELKSRPDVLHSAYLTGGEALGGGARPDGGRVSRRGAPDPRREPCRGRRGALRAVRARLGPRRPGRLRRRAADGDAAAGAGGDARRDRRARAAAADGADALAEHERTPEFAFVRALAIEAYYSDFVAPGKEGPGAWAEIDFNSPLATRLAQGLVVPGDRVKDRFDVVVVGSGAGRRRRRGRARAARPRRAAARDRPHLTAADFARWEAKATHDLWWPLRLAPLPSGEMVAFLAGRCVGGTTTINTKVALRAHEQDVAKWHAADRPDERQRRAVRAPPTSIRTTTGSSRCSACASGPTGRRASTRSSPASRRSAPSSSRSRSYTDANCMRCGSCLQGCPTNAGKSTQNTYIHDALGARAARAARRGGGRARAGRGRRGDRASSTSTRRASGTRCAPRRSSSPPAR